MLLLGDGFSLDHISDGWEHARMRSCGTLPRQCPEIGVSCWLNGSWLAVAAFFPTGSEWMVAEYLTFTNDPDVTWRTKNEAFKRAVPTMVGIATCHGKRLLFPSSSKGVTAILRNMGVAYSSGLDLLVGP